MPDRNWDLNQIYDYFVSGAANEPQPQPPAPPALSPSADLNEIYNYYTAGGATIQAPTIIAPPVTTSPRAGLVQGGGPTWEQMAESGAGGASWAVPVSQPAIQPQGWSRWDRQDYLDSLSARDRQAVPLSQPDTWTDQFNAAYGQPPSGGYQRSAYGGAESYATPGNVIAPPEDLSAAWSRFLDSGYRAPIYAQFPLQENQWLTGMKPENYVGPTWEQVAMAYPGFRREFQPQISGIQVFAPSGELGLGERGMYAEPARSQYPQGSIHLYGRDPAVELHEYAHALSVPNWSNARWADFNAAVRRFLDRPDPQHWRLQAELGYGYGSTSPQEGYAEVARVAGGNLANIPPELRQFFPWLSVVPQAAPSPSPAPESASWSRPPTREALDVLNMTPQQVEHVRVGLQNVERWGYDPQATQHYIEKAQQVLRNTDPRVIEAYGGWPRWLPR